MNHMDCELYDAVINDDIDVFEEMEGKVDVDDQLTPTNVLHLACQYGNMKCVRHILSVHESLLLKLNSRGETALHLAAREGHYDVVVALINKAKSSLVQIDYLQNRSSTVVMNLIRLANVEFETALHAAVRYNHGRVVQLLVTEDPCHRYPQNKHNETPLYLASIRRYTGIIRTILDNCTSPTFGGPDGRTALHAAVLNDEGGECVKLLLEKNRNLVKEADNFGWTAFHYVAYNDLCTIVGDLVRANKSVYYQADKDYKRTGLHVAAYRGNVRVMMEFLKYFPDSWEIVDGSGRNILHIAVQQHRKKVIRFILSHGGKARNNLFIQRDKEGNTPLHLIAKLGCYVPELMDIRALDWEVLDNKNLTPLDVLNSGYKDDTLVDQALIRKALLDAKVKNHWQLWRTIKEPDVEKEKYVSNQEQVEEYNKKLNTHMIVAALIATVALTAGFAMPGGFDGNEGPTQGSAILLRKAAFKAFMITDTIAMILSISSLFLYFVTTLYRDARIVGNLVVASAFLNVLSIIAMTLAFITGTYAVLAHSSALAISVSVISSLFFLLVFSILFIKMFRSTRKKLGVHYRDLCLCCASSFIKPRN